MSAPHVAIVGGGLAGLAAALDCADAGARVSLFEARPRLGGATWSTAHRGLEVDNGQHVFLRCCEAYRGFLERLGVRDRVSLQDRLAVPVASPGRPLAWIRRGALPAPAHLARSLLAFHPLPFAARVRAALSARRIATLDPDDPALDTVSLGDWLALRGESDAAIDGLWDLLVRATLNLPAREASLALAVKVLRTGFLDRADAADVGWSRVPLSRLHAEPAEAALRKAGTALHLRAPVDAIECRAGGPPALRIRGAAVEPDAVILACDHEAAARLLPASAGVDTDALRALGRSPIVNLHVVLDRRVLELPFLAGFGTPLQWIFDRTRASGVESGQVLAISLSGADAWLGRSNAELRAVFLPALEALLPTAREARVLDFFTTREPAATFRQAPGTRALRPPARTAASGLFLAGAWTATGWPATMEGAVRSGRAAATAALADLRVSRAREAA
ncbi:MAG TPA: hydroxysqualene dehydroxylase HpnE [Myxococcota bacterium]|nr:hydroxysqualene dehydroxylase HpnE [Myxococcota bacterium]